MSSIEEQSDRGIVMHLDKPIWIKYVEMTQEGSVTSDQLRFLDRIFESAKAEILSDIVSGRIPPKIGDFDDLKSCVENAYNYGGMWSENTADEGAKLFPPPNKESGLMVGYQNAVIAIGQRLDDWLKVRSEVASVATNN